VPDEAFTIGEAARRAGLTPKAIRLYEARGLLPAARRSPAGYRRYTGHDLRLLEFIRRAREVGLGLREIGAIIGLRRAGTPPSAEVMALLRGRLAAIDRQIGDLGLLRATLAEVVDTAASKASGGDEVRLCRILDLAPGTRS
jgi:DNA-binding transcriptional MerR regulator